MSTVAKQLLRLPLLRISTSRALLSSPSSSSPLSGLRPISAAAPTHRPLRPSVAISFHSSAARMTVHEFKTLADFEAAVKENQVVVLDCTASWCGPCKMMSPIFDKLSEQESLSKVYFAKFDVDEVPELAQKLGIRAMPTFKAFKNGEQVEEMLGANPPALESLVAKVNPES